MGTQFGFLAQEVEQTALGAAVAGEEGHKGLEYSQLIAPTVRAVQELADLVDARHSAHTTQLDEAHGAIRQLRDQLEEQSAELREARQTIETQAALLHRLEARLDASERR